MKICVFVGTRPEIIRLSCVIKFLKKHCDLFLIHTGQNYDYELNKIFFEDLELDDPYVYLDAAGTTSAETIGNVIIKSDECLRKIMPDCVLVLGDTNSCLAVLAAKRLKIPIFHMEAGNRCFDQCVPEEINRKIVDHISDINLTYSSIAREYLLREGVMPDRIIKIGSPMMEVISDNKDRIEKSKITQKLKLMKDNYFLVSVHREENVDSINNLDSLLNSINMVCEIYKLPVIVSTHPRTRKALQEYDKKVNSLVTFLNPFSFTDYVNLQINAKVVLSDSGTITEESSILGFPALNLRDNHERAEGMEEAAVIMVGRNSKDILNGIKYLLLQTKFKTKLHKIVGDYNVQNVSEKVYKIICSYTPYINKYVWRKDTETINKN